LLLPWISVHRQAHRTPPESTSTFRGLLALVEKSRIAAATTKPWRSREGRSPLRSSDRDVGGCTTQIDASVRSIERNAERQLASVATITELERRAKDIGEITRTVS
jgi:hypothetical protein